MEIQNAHVGRGFRMEKHVSEPLRPIKDKFTWKARWKKVHVEIHEENYEGYKKRKMIISNQKNVIQNLNMPVASRSSQPTIPYEEWNIESIASMMNSH